MPEKTFKLEIVTPNHIAYDKDVVSITVPGVDGSLGILANHAPLMVELTIGVITIVDAAGQTHFYATSGGFMEVNENTVRILADTAESSTEIDVARAEEAKKRAEERLHIHKDDIDLVRAEASLKRAIARIRAAHHE